MSSIDAVETLRQVPTLGAEQAAAIAAAAPLDMAELLRIDEIGMEIVENHGEQILQIVGAAVADDGCGDEALQEEAAAGPAAPRQERCTVSDAQCAKVASLMEAIGIDLVRALSRSKAAFSFSH
jgi:hypothetical protein